MSDDGADRRFLIGYGKQAPGRGICISLAGELDPEAGPRLDACRAHIRAMPVSRICLDLRALRVVDQAGVKMLVAMCRKLRIEGFVVEVGGGPAQVRAALLSVRLAQERTYP